MQSISMRQDYRTNILHQEFARPLAKVCKQGKAFVKDDHSVALHPILFTDPGEATEGRQAI